MVILYLYYSHDLIFLIWKLIFNIGMNNCFFFCCCCCFLSTCYLFSLFCFFLNSFNAVSHTTRFNSGFLPSPASISSGALSPSTPLGLVTFKSFYRVVILEAPLIAILQKSFTSLFFLSHFLGFLPLIMASFYGMASVGSFLGKDIWEVNFLKSFMFT